MRPIILKVYLSNNSQTVSDVPITPETTCRDVIECCKEPGEEHCHLAELWRGCERPIGEQERPYEILQQWGIHRDEVKFYLRHEPAVPLGQRSRRKNGMKEPESLPEGSLSGGVDLTLTELQEMAARQQQQIETQQQMLVAKEQRLKYLKQQEMKHQQIASENERLHKLRLRVEEQELKLRKLRALRGQVDQQKFSNGNLTSELESIRCLFNEKEKELAMAVSKVEELTKQLEEIRRGRLSGLSCDPSHTYSATIELEKLHRELMIRNKMNEQQNSKINAHREVLSHRQEEMMRMDRRIAELTERLRKKRAVNEQLSNEIISSNKSAPLRNNSNANVQNNSSSPRNRPLSANVAAVEPYKHVPKEVIHDDIHTKLIITDDLPEFGPNKKDPKYQTLPYNTKFSVSESKKVKFESDDDLKETSKTVDSADKDTGTEKITHSDDKPRSSPLHSKQSQVTPSSSYKHSVDTDKNSSKDTSLPAKNTISHFVPKPYGSTYSSSILTPAVLSPNNVTSLRGQPEGNNGASSPILKITNNNNPINPSSNRNINPRYSSAPHHENHSPNKPDAWSFSKSSRSVVSAPSLTPPVSNVQPQVRSPIFHTSSPSPHPLSPLLMNHKDQDSNSSPTYTNVASSGNSLKQSPASTNSVKSLNIASENMPKSLLSVLKDSSYSPSSNSLSSEGSSASLTSPSSSNEDTPKPVLPPRPSASIKPSPPPRLTHSHSQEDNEQAKKKIDISQKALESAMTILRGNNNLSNLESQTNGNNPPSYKYAPKMLISNSYSRRLGSTTQDQYRKIMDQLYNSAPAKPDESESSDKTTSLSDTVIGKSMTEKDRSSDPLPPPYSSVNNSQQERISPENEKGLINNDQSVKNKHLPYKKISSSDLKIKNGPQSPKKQPLENIRTHTNSHNGTQRSEKGFNEAPNVHISINRRIEMPPDFLLPEMTPPDISSSIKEGYNNNGNNNNSNNSNSNNVSTPPENQNYDNRYITPPRYPNQLPTLPTYQETEENRNKNTKLKKQETENSPSYDNQENGNTLQSPTYSQNHQERNHSPPKQVEIIDDKDNKSPTHQTYGNSNANGQLHSSGNKQSTSHMVIRRTKGNLKTKDSIKNTRRVSFDPLALLLDASLEGELELVMKTAREVSNPSAANDEGITALHNAICAGHFEIVKFLVEFGCDVNAQDSDGWTPLHCAASCNNVPMVKFLVEHGACIFATTLSDHETAAEKCEEDEEGFDGCSEYLYSVQEKLGIINSGAVYSVYEYDSQNHDELTFKDGDMMIVLRKGDEFEREWWWARLKDREGYIPRNLLGLYPRVTPRKDS